jgi:lariat debranching enzyme
MRYGNRYTDFSDACIRGLAFARSDFVNIVRFVALGDLHGSFAHAAEAMHAAADELGGLDLALCVGDAEANRNAKDAAGVATGRGHRRWVGEFPMVLRGEIDFPAPLYFIGGDHEPWATLDAQGPGEIGGGVHFMGRAGVREIGGLNIAFISGVRGPASEGDMFSRHGRDERACWVRAEMIALERAIAKRDRIDIMMSHDWPHEVLGEDGDEDLARIGLASGARLHLCGHRHRPMAGLYGETEVLALSEITGEEGWAAFKRLRNGTMERVA